MDDTKLCLTCPNQIQWTQRNPELAFEVSWWGWRKVVFMSKRRIGLLFWLLGPLLGSKEVWRSFTSL